MAPNGAVDLAWFSLAILSVKDVGPRGRTKGRVTRAAERSGSPHLFAGACIQPVAPIKPPASLPLLDRGHKSVGCIRTHGPTHDVPLRLARPTQKPLTVPPIRQHNS